MNNPNWVSELLDSIDSMDTTKFVSFLTDDAVFTFGNSPSAIGKDIVYQVVDGFFKSIKAISHTDRQTLVDGDFVIVRGNSTYTRHDDSKLTVGFCNVFKMNGSLVQDYRIYIDLSQLYI
jgi:ketosteroid isomerase-like protein